MKNKTVKELEQDIKELNDKIIDEDDNRKRDRLRNERDKLQSTLDKKRRGRKPLETRSIRFDPDDLQAAEFEELDISEICRAALSRALVARSRKILKGVLK